MIIKPKIRGFICTAAHPVGCSKMVEEQIQYVKSHAKFKGPKRALIIGSSTGYGLASRIAATFGADAKTIGVFFEREASDKRTATAGWYNTAAFERIAQASGHYAKSINGDAFSDEIKKQVADLIREELKTVDLVIYSLASPRRTDPRTGTTYSSVLKPIGKSFTSKTVDPFQGEVKAITIEPATSEETEHTVKVMGGEDWEMWMNFLLKEKLLAEGVQTIAYSYVGPKLTHSIYKEGTIGKAKEDLHETADRLTEKLKSVHGNALISVNKGLVTQASSAIPVVPLYISLLYKIMKEKGTHEGCIEQIYRMFHDKVYSAAGLQVDTQGWVRMDDYEMEESVQKKIAELWPQINTENLAQLSDIKGYRHEFNRLFGFEIADIDYDKEVDPNVKIPSVETEVV
jgi:enoyl-[acyl-carrier protein] reductase/trans-2-enoyl-CoA reductase (NAD+)